MEPTGCIGAAVVDSVAQTPRPVDDEWPGIAPRKPAEVEPRIVGKERGCGGEYSLVLRTQLHGCEACKRCGETIGRFTRLAARIHESVGRLRPFQRDERTVECLRSEEYMVEPTRFIGEHARNHLCTGLAEHGDAAPVDFGIRIAGSHYHTRYTCFNQQSDAGRCLSEMRTWLQSHIYGRLPQQRPVGFSYRCHSIDFGMPLSASTVPPLPYHSAVGSHNHGADHGIGHGESASVGGELQGTPHIFFVKIHRFCLHI